MATSSPRGPKANLDEVMEVMTEQMRAIRTGRADLDIAGRQTGVCNTLLKGMLLDLHERMFSHKLEGMPLKELE